MKKLAAYFMNGEIINYLTVQLLSDKTFEAPYAQRVRTAWIIAKKKYVLLTDKEKQAILNEIAEDIRSN
jgi:hypothetical protein